MVASRKLWWTKTRDTQRDWEAPLPERVDTHLGMQETTIRLKEKGHWRGDKERDYGLRRERKELGILFIRDTYRAFRGNQPLEIGTSGCWFDQHLQNRLNPTGGRAIRGPARSARRSADGKIWIRTSAMAYKCGIREIYQVVMR